MMTAELRSKGLNGQRPLASSCWTTDRRSTSCSRQTEAVTFPDLLTVESLIVVSIPASQKRMKTHDEGLLRVVGVAAADVQVGGVYSLNNMDKVLTVNLQAERKQHRWTWRKCYFEQLKESVWLIDQMVSYCSEMKQNSFLDGLICRSERRFRTDGCSGSVWFFMLNNWKFTATFWSLETGGNQRVEGLILEINGWNSSCRFWLIFG